MRICDAADDVVTQVQNGPPKIEQMHVVINTLIKLPF